ncbi:MAG: alanine dehydrogenase, partial [Bacteroidota bacterium]
MEIPSIQGLAIERGLMPLEKAVAVREHQRQLRIGVPREAVNEERRVALAPYGAGILAAAGHRVYIQRGAGEQAHFSDVEYSE